jgi:hypothetical protein
VIAPIEVVKFEADILDWIENILGLDENCSEDLVAEAAYFLCNLKDPQSRDRCNWVLHQGSNDEYALIKRYQGRQRVRYFLEGDPIAIHDAIKRLGEFVPSEPAEINELRLVVPHNEMYTEELINQYIGPSWIEDRHNDRPDRKGHFIVSRMVGNKNTYEAAMAQAELQAHLDEERFDIRELDDCDKIPVEDLFARRHPGSGFRWENAIKNKLHKVVVDKSPIQGALSVEPERIVAIAGVYGRCNIKYAGVDSQGRNLYLLGDTVRDDQVIDEDGQPITRLGQAALHAVMQMIFEKDPTALVVTDTISDKSTEMCEHLGLHVVRKYNWFNYVREGTSTTKDPLAD